MLKCRHPHSLAQSSYVMSLGVSSVGHEGDCQRGMQERRESGNSFPPPRPQQLSLTSPFHHLPSLLGRRGRGCCSGAGGGGGAGGSGGARLIGRGSLAMPLATIATHRPCRAAKSFLDTTAGVGVGNGSSRILDCAPS
jgi:hypothetical protein